MSVVRGPIYRGEFAVYNLTVEDGHEYFANGVLTHNCDTLRYLAMAANAGRATQGLLSRSMRKAVAPPLRRTLIPTQTNASERAVDRYRAEHPNGEPPRRRISLTGRGRR